jgi:ATP-dependent RNA helicase DDX3X
MANQLNMNGLSLNDSKHAGGAMPNGRPAYIPPHMRGQQGRSGPPPMDGPATLPPGGDQGLGGSAWGNPR